MSGGLDQSRLREQAKKRLDGKRPLLEKSAEDNVRLVEELSLHQEELSIQNEELLRIQAELELSKAKYFELYDLAPVGYITLSSGLMIKEANLSTSTLLGTERRDLIGRGLSTFVLPHSQESMYHHYKRLDHGMGKQVGTFLVRGGNGKELQVQFESNRIEDGHDPGFRSILTDVTEKKEVEVELERTKARLEAIINQMPVGIMVADAQSGGSCSPMMRSTKCIA